MYGEQKNIAQPPGAPKRRSAERRRFLGLELWQQIVAGLAVAAIVAILGIASHHLVSSSRDPVSTPTRSVPSTPQPITAEPSTPMQEPIRFLNLNEDEKIGALIQPLMVTGTMPSGERAWVFVRSSGAYYIQGTLKSKSPDFWTLPSVSLGSAAGPIDAPYTISVVLANSQGNRTIGSDYSKTGDGNTGISAIPDGAKVICSVTVIRTH
jgi:hypothetical protein